MWSNRSVKATASLVLAGALLAAAVGIGLAKQRTLAHAAGTADMGRMMGTMDSMTEAMSSQEFKAMVQACQAFMSSPAMQHMPDHGMGGTDGSS